MYGQYERVSAGGGRHYQREVLRWQKRKSCRIIAAAVAVVDCDDCFFVDGSIQLCLKMQLFPRASSWCDIVVLLLLLLWWLFLSSQFCWVGGTIWKRVPCAMVEEKEKACFCWITMAG